MYISPVLLSSLKYFGLSQSLEQSCLKSWQVGEPLEIDRRNAIYQQRDLEKVTGFAPLRNMELELGRLSQSLFSIPPATFLTINNAIHADGNLYANRTKHLIAGNTSNLIAKIDKKVDEEGTIVSNRQSHQYFGHWLHDELPLTAFCQQSGAVLTTHIGRNTYPHENGYYESLEIEPPTELENNTIYRRLNILQPNSINSLQIRQIYNLHAKISSKIPRKNNGIVFIRRGGNIFDYRNICNEQEIIESIQKIGGDVIDPYTDSAEMIIKKTFGAQLVIGVEGSHLANAILTMNIGGGLLVIQPPNRFNNIFKDLCDATDRTYAFTVADQTTKGNYQKINELSAAIDRCNIL